MVDDGRWLKCPLSCCQQLAVGQQVWHCFTHDLNHHLITMLFLALKSPTFTGLYQLLKWFWIGLAFHKLGYHSIPRWPTDNCHFSGHHCILTASFSAEAAQPARLLVDPVRAPKTSSLPTPGVVLKFGVPRMWMRGPHESDPWFKIPIYIICIIHNIYII